MIHQSTISMGHFVLLRFNVPPNQTDRMDRRELETCVELKRQPAPCCHWDYAIIDPFPNPSQLILLDGTCGALS